MNESEKKNPPKDAAKKPYKKPRIQSRERIEGRANVCAPPMGKATGVSCNVLRS